MLVRRIKAHSSPPLAAKSNNVGALRSVWSKGEGSESNNAGRGGSGALHYAVLYRCKEAVKWLLEEGADPNEVNEDGATPLHFAIKDKEGKGIRDMLIKAGGDLSVKGKSAMWEGEKDVDEAIMCQRGKGGMGNTRLKLIGSLMAFGDLIYAPLISMARDGDVEGVLRWLDENEGEGGMDVDGPEGWEGSTALCHAASGGSLEVCRILVERGGANVGLPREPRANALHYSVFKMHKGVFNYLMGLEGGKEAKSRRGESQLWGSMGAVDCGELARWNVKEAERLVELCEGR